VASVETLRKRRIIRIVTAASIFVVLTLVLRGLREGFNVRSAHAVFLDDWMVNFRLDMGLNIRIARVTCDIAVWATRLGFGFAMLTLLATRRWARALILLVVAVTALNAVEYGVKPLIDRRTLATPDAVPSAPVFPSGQSTVLGVLVCVAATTTFSQSQRRAKQLLVVSSATTVAVSAAGLAYSGCHYVTDILGGLCVGVAAADVVLLIFEGSSWGRREAGTDSL
jgi:membrane-associated phospholipid phosphatase